VIISEIALPDPCKFVSNIGLDEPPKVNEESYVPSVVVYLNTASAVSNGYVVGTGIFGLSQSKAIPKLIVDCPSGLVNIDKW
jgi:hypothetical protein